MNQRRKRPRRNRNKKPALLALIVLLIVYSIAIIYFMFFGFNRPEFGVVLPEYQFSLILNQIPLWFPAQLSFDYNMNLWLFSMGNLLAFVPFGILVPMAFGSKYLNFMFVFLSSIISLEILQMITYLGSFDVEDILVNVIGATIGFVSFKIGGNAKGLSSKIIFTLFSIIVFTLLTIGFAEAVNGIIRD